MPIEKLRVRGRIDFLVAVRRLVGEWLSLVEHLVRDQGVGGSNPLSPTIFISKHLKQVAALQRGEFSRSRYRCAQNCAHPADLERLELHLRSGERT
jgi:hypothetical protein